MNPMLNEDCPVNPIEADLDEDIALAIAAEIGVTIQAWDSDLDAIAAITGTGILRRDGPGAWSLTSAGTVTSVAETVSVATAPSANLSVAGSPITTSGTLALSVTPWWIQKESIALGETLTIASGYQVIIYSEFTNSGDIINSGNLVIH